MNILIAGRLGRYAERALALRDAGHGLVYCTMPAPAQKPIPDDLKDPSVPVYRLARGRAGDAVARIVQEHRIDVIYSMKNVWDGSLELVSELLDARLGVPIVRHYKEHFCQPSALERRSLIETAGQIYINEESLAYFRDNYGVRTDTAHVLDTDYLPLRYFLGPLGRAAGRPASAPALLMAGGLSTNSGRNDVRELCRRLSARGVEVHLYGRKFVGPNGAGVWGVNHVPSQRAYEALEREGRCRLHDHVEPERYVEAWSRYDAGLMHPARPRGVDPFAYFNHPNRLVPYLASGLPIVQEAGEHKAMERLIERTGIGLLYRDVDELAEMLGDRALLSAVRSKVLARRLEFSYEHHVPALLEILSRYAR